MRQRLLGVALVGLLVVLTGGSLAGATITSVTIDDATLSSGGTVITISGTVTCTPGDFWDTQQVAVFQGKGQNQESASGYEFPYQTCTGTAQSWEVEALSYTGSFKEAKAVVRATSHVYCASCPGGQDQMSVDRVMTLRSS